MITWQGASQEASGGPKMQSAWGRNKLGGLTKQWGGQSVRHYDCQQGYLGSTWHTLPVLPFDRETDIEQILTQRRSRKMFPCEQPDWMGSQRQCPWRSNAESEGEDDWVLSEHAGGRRGWERSLCKPIAHGEGSQGGWIGVWVQEEGWGAWQGPGHGAFCQLMDFVLRTLWVTAFLG